MYWYYISQCQKLSEKFIEKYQDKINWNLISKNQNVKLSESLIEKYQDKINWNNISEYQLLSENFIKKYQDKINFSLLLKNKKILKNIIKEEIVKINKINNKKTYKYEDTGLNIF